MGIDMEFIWDMPQEERLAHEILNDLSPTISRIKQDLFCDLVMSVECKYEINEKDN